MVTTANIVRTKRQQFAAPNGTHDRNVRLLRFILPVGVGILGSMLALAPFTMTGELSFVLDKNSVDVAKERMRVTEALYRGEDSEGRPFSLKAGSAVQKSSSEAIVELSDLSARILLTDGPAQIRASGGRYDMDQEKVRVPGPVQVEAASGYRLSTNNVTVDLKQHTLQSEGKVDGRTNIGTFRADRLEADLAERTVSLTGNARLRIEQNGLRRP
ncbi:MAG: LPS export ABC transporter periplasmic protein LptC [Sphingomonadales bacterium]|nr:LPS export ABC transporter periplasmic protein LptC [Sphingomonadales bacterium]NCO99725.1 LPS export ABC transporter periplasmic protein LptC [Sphingomonadales bacterium]NCP27408.1 LPS export ABC transporter periplasmic protein LptC [Sphingomonadales bacterium]NCP42455.1 LPS export ABC transporter periplasmic protein LptC [Sphingomonadales bacterium]PIX66853.1 MAG: LPS export ABC transporter periplasmic protein LptC [Sphingomonadales bacterium CG_4_10_14_3_um_filter_58_15]